MKNCLFVLFSVFFFVSCTKTSNSEKPLKEEEFNPLDYSDSQFDSINSYFVDSIFTFFNKNEVEKDSMFVFGLTTVDFFVQKDRFPSFFTFYHRVNGTKDSYLYVAKKIENKYEVVNTLVYDEMRSVKNKYLEDVNFDTNKDIVIKSHHMSASRIVYFYHLIIQEDFKNVSSLLAMDSLYINPSQKEIVAFRDGGNFGTHEKNFYEWIDDSLTLTKYWTANTDITGKKMTEKFVIKSGNSVRVSYDTIHVEESGMDSLWYVIED